MVTTDSDISIILLLLALMAAIDPDISIILLLLALMAAIDSDVIMADMLLVADMLSSETSAVRVLLLL